MILTHGSQAIGPVLQQTRTVPIVFVSVDPVGSGHVASLARPGGNATGFTQFEYRIAGKSLELLHEIAPSISQVAVIRDPRTPNGIGQFAVIGSAWNSSLRTLSAQARLSAGSQRLPVRRMAG